MDGSVRAASMSRYRSRNKSPTTPMRLVGKADRICSMSASESMEYSILWRKQAGSCLNRSDEDVLSRVEIEGNDKSPANRRQTNNQIAFEPEVFGPAVLTRIEQGRQFVGVWVRKCGPVRL